MNIAIYSRPFNTSESIVCLNQLLKELHGVGAKIQLYRPFLKRIRNELTSPFDQIASFEEPSELAPNLHVFITLGGDGTLLDTLHFVRNTGTPVLGINLGRLGFLASVGRDEITYAVQHLASGDYLVEERSMLQLGCTKPVFGNLRLALNECTIQKKNTASMITVHTYINDEFLNSYWADGLIVATPTGSTGYSMSCGGPILLPQNNNLILTPIAAHNLNVRPVVIPDDVNLSFEIETRDRNFLITLDSRTETLDTSVKIQLKKSNFALNLVRMHNESFINALRSKLMWGIDRRKY